MKRQPASRLGLCGVCLSFAALTGCGRSASSDAGTKPQPISDAMGPDGAGEGDAQIVDVAGGRDGASVDMGIDVWPTALPSLQSVRFTVVSQRRGWALVEADRCGALSIERQNADGSWRSLVLGIPYQCWCECRVPPDSASLQSLSSGPSLTWDCRELAVVSTVVNCSTVPGTTLNYTMLHAFPQPVGPGHYRATVAVFDAFPTGCSEEMGTGRASCTDFSNGRYPASMLEKYMACPSDRTARAEFDLPESGNLDVDLLVD